NEYLVPGPNQAEAFVSQIFRIEYGAAAETFPDKSNTTAGNIYHHVGAKDKDNKRADQQEEGQAGEVSPDESQGAPLYRRIAGGLISARPGKRNHRKFSTCGRLQSRHAK